MLRAGNTVIRDKKIIILSNCSGNLDAKYLLPDPIALLEAATQLVKRRLRHCLINAFQLDPLLAKRLKKLAV
jgi:thiazole synthase ThiGH ThiG subunit